jgi:hypothetical protein
MQHNDNGPTLQGTHLHSVLGQAADAEEVVRQTD